MFGRGSAQLKAENAPTNSPQSDISNRFSLNELKRIHQQLIENKQVCEDNKNLVIEILRVIAEMVVYGDNKKIMWTENGCPIQVHVQILQTLSILISSVKNDTSLYYLLSNNHINDIINFPHDFNSDEMLGAQYASFIKTISLRLNEQTVQFFFIEETGAFPLLTKSIELVGINDPMIRISAQTAILNVYNVRDDRARSYALQEDVLLALFQAIDALMKDQLRSLQNLGRTYVKLSDPDSISKLEQATEDATIGIEDWLYYLQDLFDLNIERLQKSLLSHLVNMFIMPELIFSARKFFSRDTTGRIAHLEIEDESANVDKLKISDVCLEEDLEIVANLFYLLQISRIFSAPIIRYTLLVALFHPLSVASRTVIFEYMQMENPNSDHDLSKFPPVTFNEARQFTSLLSQDHSQRIIVLTLYTFACLLKGGLADIDSNGIKTAESVLQSLRILPALNPIVNLIVDEEVPVVDETVEPDVLNLEEDKKWKRSRLPPSTSKKDLVNPDSPAIKALLSMEQFFIQPYVNFVGFRHELFLNEIFNVLKFHQHYSLTAIQTSVQIVFLLYQATSPPDAKIDLESLDAQQFSGRLHLLMTVRSISKIIAGSLLALLDGQFTEIMLILVNEEIKRFRGRKWKNIFPKMIGNKLLALPKNHHNDNNAMDYEIPISQIENLRKIIQTFLMVRALYFAWVNDLARQSTTDDFLSLIDDKDFLCVDETNLIPEIYHENKYFDMKGKKFLDCWVHNSKISVEVLPEPAISTPSNGGSLLSTTASVLTLGLVNGKKVSKQQGVSPTTSTKKGKESDKIKESNNGIRLLLVQDPEFFVLVSKQLDHGKPNFKIFLASPLLYSDAKVDLQDKTRFKLLVRSWLPQPKMVKNDTELILSQEPESSKTTSKFSSRLENYLNPIEKSAFYNLTIQLETEQLCSLAAQHIETRRKVLTAQKLEKLKKLLTTWTSEALLVKE